MLSGGVFQEHRQAQSGHQRRDTEWRIQEEFAAISFVAAGTPAALALRSKLETAKRQNGEGNSGRED